MASKIKEYVRREYKQRKKRVIHDSLTNKSAQSEKVIHSSEIAKGDINKKRKTYPGRRLVLS